MSQTTKAQNSLRKHTRNGHNPSTPKPEKSLHTIPEDEKCKMYFKSGTCTMLLCKGMSKLAANNLDIYIDRFCRQHGSKLEGTFIFTR